MLRALLPPRGIFVPTMIVFNREPPSMAHTWIQLPGLPLLKSSIAEIVFMPPLAVIWRRLLRGSL